MFNIKIDIDDTEWPLFSRTIPYRSCDGKSVKDVVVRIDQPKVIDSSSSGTLEPLSWLNSATMTVSMEDDSVAFDISVDEPRGAMRFSLTRLPDGRLTISVPYPEEGAPHVPLAQLHNGVMVAVSKAGDGADRPRIFISDEEE